MRLRCIQGPLQGENIEIDASQALVLGREPTSDDARTFVLASKTVSRNHCRLEILADGSLQIQDLGSSNGIRINREKVQSTTLKAGDRVQIGEFSFVVEEDPSASSFEAELPVERTPVASPSNLDVLPSKRTRTSKTPKEILNQARERFESLDYFTKLLVTILLAGFLGHWVTSFLLIEESKRHLYESSFALAREVTRQLGEQNKNALNEKAALLIDCNFVRETAGVLNAYVLDAQGNTLCPVGRPLGASRLTTLVMERGEPVDNCREYVIEAGESTCDFMKPVRFWNQSKGIFETVGYSRIEFRPVQSEFALQDLESTKFKTMILVLGLLLGAWWILRHWLRRLLETLTDNIHLAVTGNAQTLDKLGSFHAVDPLIEEINRLISRGSQGLRSSDASSSGELDFLRPLFQQLLLLEDRSILVVDKDNHFIAASGSLAHAIPFELTERGTHITDVIADTHLQGELVSLLNDLSLSSEVIDRAVSTSDRVLQVRAMPIVLNEAMAAAILIF